MERLTCQLLTMSNNNAVRPHTRGTQNVTTRLSSQYLRRREEGRGQGKEERNVERVVEAAEGEGGEEPMEMS